MSKNRALHLAEQVRQVVSQSLYFDLRDPALDGVTITRVKVTPDLQYADFRFTTLNDEDTEMAHAALERAVPALRRVIAGKINLRRVPNLRFHIDDDMIAERRIGDILEKLHIPPAEEDETRDT